MNTMQLLMMREQSDPPARLRNKSLPQPAPYPQPKPGMSGLGELGFTILIPTLGDGPYNTPDLGWLYILAGQGGLSGLGALGFGPGIDWGDDPTGTTTTTGGSNSGGGTNWTKFLMDAGIYWSNILGKYILTKNQPVGSGTPLTNAEVAALIAAQKARDDEEDVGAGKDGLNLFGTKISYSTLLVLGVAFVLIQSPSIGRRR